MHRPYISCLALWKVRNHPGVWSGLQKRNWKEILLQFELRQWWCSCFSCTLKNLQWAQPLQPSFVQSKTTIMISFAQPWSVLDLKLYPWSFAKIWSNHVINFHLLIIGWNIFKIGSSDRLVGIFLQGEWYYFTQTHNTLFSCWPWLFLEENVKIWTWQNYDA